MGFPSSLSREHEPALSCRCADGQHLATGLLHVAVHVLPSSRPGCRRRKREHLHVTSSQIPCDAVLRRAIHSAVQRVTHPLIPLLAAASTPHSPLALLHAAILSTPLHASTPSSLFDLTTLALRRSSQRDLTANRDTQHISDETSPATSFIAVSKHPPTQTEEITANSVTEHTRSNE